MIGKEDKIMIRTNDELREYLTKRLSASIADTKQLQQWLITANLTYDIPNEIASDYISLRKSLTDANEFILFIFLSVIDKEKIPSYFAASRIKEYATAKYKVERPEFPLRFKLIQIAEDQWIGKITAKELMKLKEAQITTYNENTQRPMRKIISGEHEGYQIFLNEAAVRSIDQLFDSRQYIPNTITLNLPETAEYYYDIKTEELVITKPTHLDILDGYHRYIAIARAMMLNDEFDHSMELRIVAFPEWKANQFIWQEDQKTKMKKTDSDSMNLIDSANKVVNRLNENPLFNLSGKITRNKGIIKVADFTKAVRLTYFYKIKERDRNKKEIEVTKELLQKINSVTEERPDLITKEWDQRFIVSLVYACYIKEDVNDIIELTDYLYEQVKTTAYERFFAGDVTLRIMTELKKLTEGRK